MEFQKLSEIIAEVLGVDTKEITRDTTFMEDLGADSLDAYQILLKAQDMFGVQFEASKVEKITTVGEAEKLIQDCSK